MSSLREYDVRRAVLVVLAVVMGVGLTACSKSSADTFAGAVLHEPYHVPATELTDTGGRPYSLATDTTKPLTLVFFGYTHCPDECPTTMATLASAMLQLDDSDRANVQVVFVTTDPARDTGPVLRRWLDHFSSSFVGLTGSLDTIKKVATDVGVPIEKGRRLSSGGYDVTHGTQVLGVDSRNNVPVVWTLGTTAPEFAHDIHQLLS
jgi:protein SCO1